MEIFIDLLKLGAASIGMMAALNHLRYRQSYLLAVGAAGIAIVVVLLEGLSFETEIIFGTSIILAILAILRSIYYP